MLIFLIIVLCILIVLLIYVESFIIPTTEISVFELERRAAENDHNALIVLRREKALDDLLSLKHFCVVLLLLIIVVGSLAVFGWVIGSLIALIVGLSYAPLARSKVVMRSSSKLYARSEHKFLRFIEKHTLFFEFIRIASRKEVLRIGSKEELQYLLKSSKNILSSEEKKLVINGLSFEDRQIREIMTPKSVIDTVKKTEFLGPLMLDELHKKGHNRLPVIDTDIDHIIGILHLQGLLALDIKRSVSAEKAMEPQVFYIREDQTLQHALAAFLRTRHQLFIVINEFRETVGLISLEDVIEALLGRKIVDEFDAHDDLRAVALRNPHDNNQTENAKDV
jgi:CBS domain containing-hemolysin-like protein